MGKAAPAIGVIVSGDYLRIFDVVKISLHTDQIRKLLLTLLSRLGVEFHASGTDAGDLWRACMFLDIPKISATNSETEPDRLERLSRVYGYALALSDIDNNLGFSAKVAKLHDHKGNLVVIWYEQPSSKELTYFLHAWQSRVGDESSNVEHALMLTSAPEPAAEE